MRDFSGRSIKTPLLLAALLTACLIWSGMIMAVRAETSDKNSRTILFYGCGSDLEDDGAGFLSGNLRQIMNARIRPDMHIVVMTGGSASWELEEEYLEGADTITVNEKQRHQIWECSGTDENGSHGKMKLLGTIPEVVAKSMSDPATLQAFIDYGAAHYPADRYDLICWDHGGGPAGGFALDNLDGEDRAFMPLGDIVRALKNSAVVTETGYGKFEMIDFDACMMGNVEIVAALAPYTDYFVGSAEVEPPYGHEYTTWLNRLYENPDMDGYETGREIVDAFCAFYSRQGEEWSGSRATLAVIDTKNFMTRMLPPLKEMTEILLSEACEKGAQSGRYNFYDEIITLGGSMIYGKSGQGLIDTADFAGRLGICLTEPDKEHAAAGEEWKNRYTACAAKLVRILNDRDFSGDDVIYAGASESMEGHVDYQLRLDGEGEPVRVSGAVAPGCFSFLLGSSLMDTVQKYVESLESVCSGLDRNDPVREFFDDLKKAALVYAFVMDTGTTVSSRSERGEDTSFPSVIGELTDMGCSIDEYIALAKAQGLSDIEEWLAQVVGQHSKEALREENITVDVIRNAGLDGYNGYYISIADSSLQVVDNVKLQTTVGLAGEEDRECMLKLGSFEGTIAPDMMITGLEKGDEPLVYAYRSPSCAFMAQETDPDWYELSFPGGSSVIALDQERDGSGTDMVPVKLMRRGVTDPDEAEYGALEVSAQPDGSLKILGYAQESRVPLPTIPIDNDSLDGASIILIGTVLINGEDEMMEDLSGPISLTGDAGRGLSIAKKPLSQIRGVDADKRGAVGWVNGIYWNSLDITEKLREAERKAENGEYKTDLRSSDVVITVSDAVYNGEPQEPDVSVRCEGTLLAEGTDYRVFYHNNTEPGNAYTAVFGIGKYCGMGIRTFTIGNAAS